MKNKSFYFLRHGQIDWNVQGRVAGQVDVPLNRVGIEQAHIASDKMKSLSFDAIFASPFERALKTAEIVNKHHNHTINLTDEFKPRSWGAGEGAVKGPGFKDLYMYETDPKKLPQGAELNVDFSKRIVQGFEKIQQTDQTSLIVAHGGVFFFLCEYLGIKNMSAANAEPMLFMYEQGEWKVCKAI